jgi:AcrR family transcriptional regulator
MSAASLQEARQAVVRDRVLDGVATLLRDGEELTFAKVAAAAGVPERTVYRHFPTREALLTAVFEWANRQIGQDEPRPTTGAQAVATVRRTFPVFDDLAPVVRELLLAPEGLAARLSANDERRRAAVAVVRHEAPDLDEVTTRRLAAVVQLLSSASAWQALHDYWQLDGAEAAETAALAIEMLLTAAGGRRRRTSVPAPTRAAARKGTPR